MRRINLAVLAALLVFALPADAQGRGRGSGKAPAKHVVSSDIEIRIIREYYGAVAVKPKPLPPGIARNLARGKPLPPGIARTRVPDALLVRLPARTGTRWIVAGDLVLLVDAGDVIIDIVRAIL